MIRSFFLSLSLCIFSLSTHITKANDKQNTGRDTLKLSTLDFPIDPYLKLADDVQQYAKNFLHVRYIYGGKTPKGFDCSGFIRYCYKKFDMPLTVGSSNLNKLGYTVLPESALPGDLIFFGGTTGRKNRISHVGMVVEVNDCAVKFIHASVGNGVRYDLLTDKYYTKHFVEIRRVIDSIKNYKYD